MFSTPNPLKAHLVSGRSVFRHQAVTLNRRCASHQTSLITIAITDIIIAINNISTNNTTITKLLDRHTPSLTTSRSVSILNRYCASHQTSLITMAITIAIRDG